MSRLVELGNFVGSGKLFKADLDIVLRSNALVQANSGGGKSWLLRRMIEQSFRRVPQIIIDPEGEFSTLREKFDFVLVGKGGDTPADMRSAALLAHRLLELGTSAIIDLYEMSKLMRPQWVAAFVQALVDAPKKLWRELLLYVDEAHELAPEPGHGGTDSRDEKLCRHALIDLAAKGRKRGYGVVAATQRLGKLSKDFAAELKNALVGQTWIDIDRERAAGTLGISKAAKQEFFQNVKNLEPGNFFGLGRAFMLEPTLVHIGEVETEHPTPGRRQSAPPPPTAKIKHLLPQLADLPKEAEQKVLTEKELRARIAELEREAKSVKVVQAPPSTPVKVVGYVERAVLPASTIQRLERLVVKLGKGEDKFVEIGLAAIEMQRDRLAQAQQAVVSELGNVRSVLTKSVQLQGVPVAAPRDTYTMAGSMPVRPARPSNGVSASPPPTDSTISRYGRELLNVIAQRGIASDAQISTLSGYRRTSSAFGRELSKLEAAGLITGTPAERAITAAGRVAAGATAPLPTGPALLDHWLAKLTRQESAFLKAVYQHGVMTREELSERTPYKQTSSSFGRTLGALNRLGLIHVNGNELSISETFS